MYPAQYFALFPAFPIDNRVFVAMPFSPTFEKRWENVISPAISATEYDAAHLLPHRVDRNKSGDSILTEILLELGRCRLIIADVSTISKVDNLCLRNANVLYEVGLAHAIRLPEEVVLLRSDDDLLPFDIANVRVHKYSPDGDTEAARLLVSALIRDALDELDLTREASIQKAADSLDFEAWDVLYSLGSEDEVVHPTRQVILKELGLIRAQSRVAAIQRLLDIGAISTRYSQVTPDFMYTAIGVDSARSRQEIFSYTLTAFGACLLRETLERMEYFTPENEAALDRYATLEKAQQAIPVTPLANGGGSSARPNWFRGWRKKKAD